MRFPMKALCSIVTSFALSLPLALLAHQSQAAEPLVSRLPSAERNVFILDISNSTNVKSNWSKSLRPSIIKKLLQEPFGFPASKEQKATRSPIDIYVSYIAANSIDSPIFPVVTFQDAEKIWGLIDQIGTNPTQKRLELITDDLFGGNGSFRTLSEGFSTQPITVPSQASCVSRTQNSFSKTKFIRDLSVQEKKDTASTLCEVAISISTRIERIDNFFDKPSCGGYKACSDVIGALLSMSYSAADLYENDPKARLCIAIASDMLNNFPSMKKDSSLNSRRIAETSLDADNAKDKGKLAAQLTGISFPKKMKVRIFILGQGSGKNPLPLDKNALLIAYWNGFLEVAGITSNKTSPSLDQACSK